MAYISFTRFLALLSPQRRPVGELWAALRVERRELTAWIAANRDALAAEGVQLHTATHSQARALTLHIEIDGARYAALSRPQVEQKPPRKPRKAPPAPAAAPEPAPLAVVEAAPLALQRDPLDLAAAAWLDSKAGRSGSTRTREIYGSTLGDARAALRTVRLDLDSDPRAVALALQGWARHSKRGGAVKPATVAQRLAVVSSFYTFTLKRGLVATLASNPADMVERPQVESYSNVRPLDPATVRKALGALRKAAEAGDAAAARDYALLRVALTTGRRVAELAALRWKDVEIIDGAQVTLTFRRVKGGKVLSDTLAASVAGDLLRWLHRHYGATLGALPHDAPLWPALKRAGSVIPGDAMRAEGLAEVVQRRLGVSPHKLRHTFAHGMKQAGAKDSETQARLGHSSLATTGRYLAQLNLAHNPHADALASLFDPEP